jgi:hypothetical protein
LTARLIAIAISELIRIDIANIYITGPTEITRANYTLYEWVIILCGDFNIDASYAEADFEARVALGDDNGLEIEDYNPPTDVTGTENPDTGSADTTGDVDGENSSASYAMISLAAVLLALLF